MIFAPSEDADQPGHLPSLITVFAVRPVGSWGPKVSLRGQQRLWSDWADAQADLSLCWAHRPFCWFCHEAAHFHIQGNRQVDETWRTGRGIYLMPTNKALNLSTVCLSGYLKGGWRPAEDYTWCQQTKHWLCLQFAGQATWKVDETWRTGRGIYLMSTNEVVVYILPVRLPCDQTWTAYIRCQHSEQISLIRNDDLALNYYADITQ